MIHAKMRPRRYDSERGCYVYDISFSTRTPLTDRTIEVARSFGLGVDGDKEHVLYRDFELKMADGDVVYITGDSGSGKSALLKALSEDLGEQAINIAAVEVDPDKPLIDTVGGTFQDALTLLSRVGLNDAFLFLRRYPELSDGQRYRYRIARMIDSGKKFWLCDEFCSTLDRTTAKIVAFNIQKLARRRGAALIVATTHSDLEDDLNPSVLIRKGWGDEIGVEYRTNEEAKGCTAVEDVVIREGTRRDYERLSHLHYRGGRLPPVVKIFAMERFGELVGVIVYCCAPPAVSGRREIVGHFPRLEEVNAEWTMISRVILHPKYRTAGLGARIVRETLPLAGRRHVELVAVMAQYNPFAEQAGMRLVKIVRPRASVVRAIDELRRMGFNPVLMASESYNLGRLGELSDGGLGEVRGCLARLDSDLFKRVSGGRLATYARRDAVGRWLAGASLGELAAGLRVLGVLGEAKAYLHWCRDWLGV